MMKSWAFANRAACLDVLPGRRRRSRSRCSRPRSRSAARCPAGPGSPGPGATRACTVRTVRAVHEHLARVGVVQPRHQLGDRALAGTAAARPARPPRRARPRSDVPQHRRAGAPGAVLALDGVGEVDVPEGRAARSAAGRARRPGRPRPPHLPSSRSTIRSTLAKTLPTLYHSLTILRAGLNMFCSEQDEQHERADGDRRAGRPATHRAR